MDSTNSPPPSELAALLDDRLKGLSLVEIASTRGYTTDQARDYLCASLSLPFATDDLTLEREIHVARLERLHQVAYTAATSSGDMVAARVAKDLLAEIQRLHSLNPRDDDADAAQPITQIQFNFDAAPQRINVSPPSRPPSPLYAENTPRQADPLLQPQRFAFPSQAEGAPVHGQPSIRPPARRR